MNDIIPPRRPLNPAPQEPVQPAQPLPPAEPLPAPSPPPEKKRSVKRIVLISAVIAIVLATIVSALAWFWYKEQLMAVTPGSKQMVKVTIPTGVDSAGIASLLKEKELIRSTSAFEWYVRVNDKAGSLQSGVYRLSKGADVPSIVDHLASGKTDTFSITFLPGNTLAKHREVLVAAGYPAATVDAALAKEYNHPLFASKPASADLEGYIYGETYEFAADATVEQILTRTFDEYYKVIEENNLVTQYKQQGLTLFQGITLASIIQREVATDSDMKQVAQVFLLRLETDMQLGSDVTYQYIADKTGVARDVNLDSPYNTRRYKGLPPGPIASPGASALLSVATPAKGDYVYFLSGDDDKTYFARTNDEHEKNIRDHCQKKCQIL